MRQLYNACITSVADYGVPVWWKNQKFLLDKYKRLQNQALRKILGAFKSSPIYAMEVEASLPPPEVRFNKICMNYSLRIMQLGKNHVLRSRVSSSFPPYDGGIDIDWSKFLDWNQENIESDSEDELIRTQSQRRRKRRKKKELSTQLFRNLSLIAELLPSLKTERIKIKWNAPWHTRLDDLIDMKVSSFSKEEEKEYHLNLVKDIQAQKKNEIYYSDGSKSDRD